MGGLFFIYDKVFFKSPLLIQLRVNVIVVFMTSSLTNLGIGDIYVTVTASLYLLSVSLLLVYRSLK